MKGFKVPKEILTCGLKHAPFAVYIYLLSIRNREGVATTTYGQIADKLDLCPRTVSSALNGLAAAGYIFKGYKRRDGRIACLRLTVAVPCCDKWVWMESHLFELHLTPAELYVYLYIKSRANKNSRAFPSLSRMHEDTGLSEKTILAAIRRLSMWSLLGRTHYVKEDQSFGNNNYIVMNWAARETILRLLRKRKTRTRKLRRRLKRKIHFSVLQYASDGINPGSAITSTVKLLL